MKTAKYIAALVALVIATACTNFDMDSLDTDISNTHSDLIQVRGRVVRFEESYVTTRADDVTTPKDPNLGETNVSCMAVALFPIENDVIQPCIYYSFEEGNNLIFTIDRGKSIFDAYGADDYFAMYIFTNIPEMPNEMPEGTNFTLEELKSYTHQVKLDYITAVPAEGFPMMGSLGDYTEGHNPLYDGKRFILKPGKTASNENGLPTIDGNPTDFISVPMPSMYAKMTFEVSLEAEQSVNNGVSAMFSMDSYSVNNIPSSVDYDDSTNSDTDVLADPKIVTYSGSLEDGKDGVIKFNFYLPERLLTPATSAEAYNYPLGDDGENVNGYSNLRDEDKKYAQRFKGKLLGSEQKATSITINGYYRSHQDHKYNVSYEIYLGEDNYGDFNIKRNKNYVNKVKIKGLTASNNQALNEDAVSIDHRVTVTNNYNPLIVNFRRETLLDAHFEIRPLRVRMNPIYLSGDEAISGAQITISVLDVDDVDGTGNNTPTWVRVEHNNGGTATSTHLENGKRKYFTTDLVSSTLSANTSIGPISLTDGSNQTFWIYVDENTATCSVDSESGLINDDVRSARIRISYSDNTRKIYEPIDYIINQHNLYPVTGFESGNTYYIEYEEEYLHNFDSESDYGATEFEGMPWGLYGINLSSEHQALFFDSKLGWSGITNWLSASAKEKGLYYDFYTKQHDENVSNSATKHDYLVDNIPVGHHFTTEIVTDAGIGELDLSEDPQSAVEYCLNKNKRNNNGIVETEDIVWYLPATSELEEIIIGGFGRFGEFQDKYYWSSQPAYVQNYAYKSQWYLIATLHYHGPYYVDDYGQIDYEEGYTDRAEIGSARATKVQNVLQTDGKYKKEPAYSGVLGETVNDVVTGAYYNYWPSGGTDQHTGTVIVTNGPTIKLGEQYRQEGHHIRSKHNRVRCVRKMN